jgi:protein translocase SecG subunit
MEKRASNSRGCFMAVVSKTEVEYDGFWSGFYVDTLGWDNCPGHFVDMASPKKGEGRRRFKKLSSGHIETKIRQGGDPQGRLSGKEKGSDLILPREEFGSMGIITVLHILVSFALILIVLLQAGKGAEIGAAFGGASQTLFGSAGAMGFLSKLTTVVAVIFMITSLLLAFGSNWSASNTEEHY